jgi:hypothetical protein
MKRKVKPPQHVDAASEDAWYDSIGIVDWKEDPESVLEIVDQMLKKHGLEIHIFKTNSDQCEFDIIKK